MVKIVSKIDFLSGLLQNHFYLNTDTIMYIEQLKC